MPFRPGRVLAEVSTGSLFSRLTRRFTGSKWTHVAIVVDEHTLVESMFPHGVREYPLATRLQELEGKEWALLELPDADGEAIVAAARNYAGRRYDFLQCVLLAVLGRFVKDGPLRVICSRLVTSAYYDCGHLLFEGENPAGVKAARWKNMLEGYCTPGDLVKYSQLSIAYYKLPGGQ